MQLEPLREEYWGQVAAFYAEGIATGHATFESEPPSWSAFATTRLPEHGQVALSEPGDVIGWVAASSVSDRCVYTGVIEHSVYVAESAQGRGIGRDFSRH